MPRRFHSPALAPTRQTLGQCRFVQLGLPPLASLTVHAAVMLIGFSTVGIIFHLPPSVPDEQSIYVDSPEAGHSSALDEVEPMVVPGVVPGRYGVDPNSSCRFDSELSTEGAVPPVPSTTPEIDQRWNGALRDDPASHIGLIHLSHCGSCGGGLSWPDGLSQCVPSANRIFKRLLDSGKLRLSHLNQLLPVA